MLLSRSLIFDDFWDLPRAPAPLLDHELLDLRVDVRSATTATTTTICVSLALNGARSF